MDGPLDIVLATDSTAPSGVGEHMLALAGSLRPRHRIVLAFPVAGGGQRFLARAVDAGFEVIVMDGDGASLSKWLKNRPTSLLHVHAGVGWEGHGLAYAGWTANVPVVRTEHLPYILTDEQQITQHRLGVALVDRLVFVSKATAESFRAAGFHGERTSTIQNGIATPVTRRSRNETRAALAIPESDFVIVTVARFTVQKGYRHLLSAIQALGALGANACFLLVGDGPERCDMEALAESLGTNAKISFLGERDDVPDLMAAADLFVLPSLFEGLPLVILEAMALGLPIVTTNIGGTVEALGVDHPWLVGSADGSALAAMISTAIADAGRHAQGDRNRRRFAERFAIERMAAETAELYRSVVAERACLA